MQKDSKYNKSPIESILKDSFEEIQAFSPYPTHENPHFADSRTANLADHSQFKISGSSGQQNIQEKLKIAQMISMAQLEISLDTMTSIIRSKVANSMARAFGKLKRVQANKNSLTTINKADRIVVIKKIQLFHQKVEAVFNARRLKNVGTSFMEIFLLRVRNVGFDKSSSIVSPYRGYSKAENSDRGDSEWELAQSQGHLGSNESLSKQNKLLKKKRQKMKANRQQFYTKIDQMLSVHENFLKK